MNELYDKRPIPSRNLITEDYIGYGKNDLSSMTNTELADEYKRTENEIKTLEDEIANSGNTPSYVLKEKLKNAKWYLSKIDVSMESVDPSGKTKELSIDDMIQDLKNKFDKGIITEEYYIKYRDMLNSRRDLYKHNKEQAELRQKEKEEMEFKKKHPFKSFKNKFNERNK